MAATRARADGSPGPPPTADLDYVRFPPHWKNILLPTRPAGAALIGMSLYTASKPIPVVLQQSLWLAARLSAGRLLPGRRERWSTPVDAQTWNELWAQWSELAGRRIEGAAVYERLQSERAALTLLLCAGRDSMLVRVRRDPETLAREQAMSAAAESRPAETFQIPRSTGHGESGGWHWVAYEAISTRPHRPRYRLPDGAFDEVSRLVEDVVTPPDGTPEHWRGAHGDIVPWNLRRGGGRTWLIDWETAGFAPPGTDRVYLDAVVAAMRSGRVAPMRVPAEHLEAQERLLSIVRDRPTTASEQRLRLRLLTLLSG